MDDWQSRAAIEIVEKMRDGLIKPELWAASVQTVEHVIRQRQRERDNAVKSRRLKWWRWVRSDRA